MPASTRDKRLTLAACILGSVIVFLDQTVVNVALPALRRDLDAGLAAQQWVVDAYLLTLASLLLVGGSLGDRLGRRRVFVAGLVGFAATSLICAVAPNAWMLCAGRALQGVAGALLVPSSLAIITATFEPHERGRAVGTWTAWTGVAFVIGPLGGGLLIDAVSWRLIFALNLPLVALALAMLARTAAIAAPERQPGGIDLTGALLCTLGLGGPVLALIEEPGRGFGHPLVAAPLLLGAACLVAFVLWERRVAHPMVPLRLFAERNFTAVNLVSLALYAGLAGMTFFLVLFLQQVAGYSAVEAGVALIPVTVLMFALSRRFGALADRVGARPLLTAGPFVACGGLVLMARLDSDAQYLGTLLPALVVFGLGLSMTVAPLTATVLGSVPQALAGTASGINNAVTRVAALLAIAALGVVVSARFEAVLDERSESAGLSEAQRSALAGVRSRPLTEVDLGSLPAEERAAVASAVDDSSVEGFRFAIAACAVLVGCGGLIALVGITAARAREEVALPAVPLHAGQVPGPAHAEPSADASLGPAATSPAPVTRS